MAIAPPSTDPDRVGADDRSGSEPRRATRRRGGPRVPAWTVLGCVVAVVVAGPLVALPASFITGTDAFDDLAARLLPEALANSLMIGTGVGVGTLVIGGGLAVLVSFYEFPGRRWLDWALVLPLAMPGYVLVFVLVGQFGTTNALQSSLFAGLELPGLRSPVGAVAVLSSVLYPYVYVLGRSAFLSQSRQAMEAARSLGRSHWGAVRSVALPMARPALAGGVALAVMEALANFGAVDLLGISALPTAIYRVWTGAFDQEAALQLATVLVGLALLAFAIERLLRGRARYSQALARGDVGAPKPLTGWRRWAAATGPVVLLAVVFALPVVQLLAWSVETITEGSVGVDLRGSAIDTVVLAAVASLVAVITSTVVAYGQRARPSRLGRVASRLATVGYAVPGTVVAVAVYVPLIWIDRNLVDLGDGIFGTNLGLVFTGTVVGLVIAYVVRFHALAFFSMESRMGGIDPNLDDAARSLGADRARVLAEVQFPLLWPGMLTAALLVAVEVAKELPATALLRPLGTDTLAIRVWEATKDSRFDAAALPALLIVALGLIPVVLLIRLTRRDGWSAAG